MKSFYTAIQNSGEVPYTFLWKIKIPSQVKNFIWLVLIMSILTRNVLLKIGGCCEACCLFCGADESIEHLFFEFPLVRYLWNVIKCSFDLDFCFTDANHCFESWLKGMGDGKRSLVTVGNATIFRSIWKAKIWHVLNRNGLLSRLRSLFRDIGLTCGAI